VRDAGTGAGAGPGDGDGAGRRDGGGGGGGCGGGAWWSALAAGVALTPNLLGSFAEVARKVSKGLIKTALLDETSVLSTHTGAVCCACVVFACAAHAVLGRIVLQRYRIPAGIPGQSTRGKERKGEKKHD